MVRRREPPLYADARMAFHAVDLELRGGATITRGLIVHPGAVVVLAVTDADEVVFIRNTRWTVGETLLELPAGTLSAGEDPAAAASRELAEETGYEAREIKPLCDFYAAPGSSTERMYAFVGTHLRHVGQRL